MAVDVGSAVGYLDLDINGFLTNLRSAQSEADKASKNIVTKFGTNMQSAGKKLTSAGSILIKSATVPIVGLGTAAIKTSSDFESAMAKVSAISGATGTDLDKLNKKAQEMGAKTKFSAAESAEAFTYMAMAGWKTEDMLSGIDGIMSLAAADGLDLATTSDIVTDALTAFGLSASDSGHFADVLAKASSNANTNVSMLGESFKYAAPVAGALGYSAEDTAIALGLMANAGIKGSQSGTALRSSLTRLIKPTDEAAALMEQYGLSMTNADGSMKSLGEVMNMLRDKLGGLTEAEQAQAAAQIFGQEAMSGALAIINASDSDYAKLTDAIYGADGAAQQMADTMLDNLNGQLTLLKSALEGLAIQFGEILMPYIKQFVTWLQNLTQRLQELTPEQKEQVVKWAAIAAAIGPVLMVLGKLTTSVGSIITTFGKIPGALVKAKSAFTAVSAAIGGISAPVVAVVAVIGVLIAAFANLWKTNEEFRNNVIAIWDGIKAKFEAFGQGIVDRLNALGFDFENFTQVVKAIWDGFCAALANVFEGVFQQISIIFDTFVDVFFGIWDFFKALFTGDWQGVWDSISGIFGSIWEGISSTFENITNTIIGIAQTVLSWFGIEWNASVEEVGNKFLEIWQSIVDFFTSVWEGVSGFFTGLWRSIWKVVGPLFDEIVGTFQMAWDTIQLIWDYAQPYFAGIWEGIQSVFSVVEEVLGGFFSTAWEAIKSVWNAVVSWFTLLWENLKAVFRPVAEFFKGIFSIAWESIKTVWNSVVAFFAAIWAGIKAVFAVVKGVLSGNFEDAWKAIKNVWDKVVNFFATIWNGIKNIFGAVVSFFRNTFSSAWEAIKRIFSNFGSFFSNLWNTIKDTFSAIGTKIGDAISGAVKSGINGLLGMIEGVVNTFIRMINGAIDIINWIPGVNLSHIDELSIPRLAAGGIVNRPTLAEIGEDGREAVVPLEKNLGWMKTLVAEFMSQLKNLLKNQLELGTLFNHIVTTLVEIRDICRSIINSDGIGYMSYGGFVKSQKSEPRTNRNDNVSGGGDTFYFYSPKPIDEIEAAKQMKKTKQDMAEGF